MNQKKNRLILFIITTLIFLLAGVSMAFFFGKDEHLVTGVWYSGDITLDSSGYNVRPHETRDTDCYYDIIEEDAYLDIFIDKTGYEDSVIDNIIIRFQNAAEKDELIRCEILDENDMPVFSEGCIWEKRGAYIRFNIERADEGVKEILSRDKIHARAYIDESFSMPMVYVSIPDDSSKLFIFALIAAIVMAPLAGLCFTFIKPLRFIALKISEGIKRFLHFVSDNWKQIQKHLEGFVVCFIVSMIIAVILTAIMGIDFGMPVIGAIFLPVTFIYMIIFMRDIFIRRIEIMGTLVVLTIGTVFSFMAPPTSGLNLDDQDHYEKVVFISSALERRVSLGEWDDIIEARSALIGSHAFDYDVSNGIAKFRSDMEREHFYVGAGNIQEVIRIKNISYITSVIPYFLGKLFHLPWSIKFMLGRWGTVLFLAIVTYISMKALKSGSMTVFMMAAIPEVMFLASSYSYDIWLLGCMMLGLSLFFGEKQDTESFLTLRKALAIAIILLISNVSKPIYFPLFMVAFFMPMYKFKEKKHYWLYKLLILFTLILPVLMVLISTLMPGLGTGDARGGEGVNAASQYSEFMANPAHGIMVIVKFLNTYLNPFYERTAWFNRLGYLGSMKIGVYGAIVLVVCAFISVNRKEPAKFPWWYRLGVLAVYYVVGFMAAFSMYIMFTPVGVETVYGCQARYILPAVFPVLFACTRWSAGVLLDRMPKLDSITRKTVLGCPMTYVRDVLIAALMLAPNVLGVCLYLVQ